MFPYLNIPVNDFSFRLDQTQSQQGFDQSKVQLHYQ